MAVKVRVVPVAQALTACVLSLSLLVFLSYFCCWFSFSLPPLREKAGNRIYGAPRCACFLEAAGGFSYVFPSSRVSLRGTLRVLGRWEPLACVLALRGQKRSATVVRATKTDGALDL